MEEKIKMEFDEEEFAAIMMALQPIYRTLPVSVRQKFRLGEFMPKSIEKAMAEKMIKSGLITQADFDKAKAEIETQEIAKAQ